MTIDLIKEQIEDIKKVTREVTQSKAAANQFLIDADIFLEDIKEENTIHVTCCAPCVSQPIQ